MQLSTPRQILAEIKRAKSVPARVAAVFTEIEERLVSRGLIDLYMSSQSIEDLLDEMVDACSQPMTGAEMAAEFDRIAKKTGILH